MPKPVLSDSLFNADDVATAVLAEANLQVTNSDLGVTDITSEFSVQTGWEWNRPHAQHFNGFVFLTGYMRYPGGTPSNGAMLTIDNSDYRPSSTYDVNGTGHQGDTSNTIQVKSDGNINLLDAHNPGSGVFYIVVNIFWNVNH